MKKYKLITYMLLFAGCLSAQDNLSALLPMPNQVKQIESKKDFIISGPYKRICQRMLFALQS